MPLVDLRQDLYRHVLHLVPEKSKTWILRHHAAEIQMLAQHIVGLPGKYLFVKRQREEAFQRKSRQQLLGLFLRIFPDDILRRVIVQIECLPIYICFSRDIRDRDLLGSFFL